MDISYANNHSNCSRRPRHLSKQYSYNGVHERHIRCGQTISRAEAQSQSVRLRRRWVDGWLANRNGIIIFSNWTVNAIILLHVLKRFSIIDIPIHISPENNCAETKWTATEAVDAKGYWSAPQQLLRGIGADCCLEGVNGQVVGELLWGTRNN